MLRQYHDLALRENTVSLEYNPAAKKSVQRPHKSSALSVVVVIPQPT